MQTQGPLTLALGTPETLTPPSESVKYRSVILSNASPFACAVSVDGPQQWLQPWTADVYDVTGAYSITVTPEFSINPSPLVTTGTLSATWLAANDQLSGTYPVSLTGVAVAALDNAAGSLLYNQTITLNSVSGRAGPVAVGSAAALLVQIQQPNVQDTEWTFEWGSDPNLDNNYQWPPFFKAAANTPSAQSILAVPCLDAYLEIVIANLTGTIPSSASVQISALAQPTDPRILIPSRTLIDVQAHALAAAASVEFAPVMVSGRMHLWAYSNGQTVLVEVMRFSGTTWDIVAGAQVPGTAWAGVVNFDFNAPSDDWRIMVTNTSATNTTQIYLSVIGPA